MGKEEKKNKMWGSAVVGRSGAWWRMVGGSAAGIGERRETRG